MTLSRISQDVVCRNLCLFGESEKYVERHSNGFDYMVNNFFYLYYRIDYIINMRGYTKNIHILC